MCHDDALYKFTFYLLTYLNMFGDLPAINFDRATAYHRWDQLHDFSAIVCDWSYIGRNLFARQL